MPSTSHPLSRMATGMLFLYVGWYVPLLALLGWIVVMLAAGEYISEALVAGWLAVSLLGPLLHSVGSWMCYANTPRTERVRPIVQASVAVSGLNLLMGLGWFAFQVPGRVQQSGFLLGTMDALVSSTSMPYLSFGFHLLSAVLFLFFLRWLGQYLGAKKLRGRVLLSFGFAAVLLPLAALTVSGYVLEGAPGAGTAGLSYLIGAVFVLLLVLNFVGTIRVARSALLSHLESGTRPHAASESVSTTRGR